MPNLPHPVSQLTAADRIGIEGLVLQCLCGCLDFELSNPQPFSFDIDMYHDLSRIGPDSELAETIDYSNAIEIVSRVALDRHYLTIENLAAAVCMGILDGLAPSAVVVTLRKLDPPVEASVASTFVTLTRFSNETSSLAE